LWSGGLPLARVFWFDMLAVGTLLNVAAAVAMLILFAADAPAAIALAVFLAPIPFNLLLFAGVWRSAAREKADWGWFAKGVATAWLVAVFFV
jgi:uncharacterized membrane protein